MDENSQDMRYAKALGISGATVTYAIIKIETLLDVAENELSRFTAYKLKETLRFLKGNQARIDELVNGELMVG